MTENISQLTARVVAALAALAAALMEHNGSYAGVKPADFGIFLQDYVIEGGNLTVHADNRKVFDLSEMFVSFHDRLFRVAAQTMQINGAGGAAYFLDFTEKDGLLLSQTHPTDPYLPLWVIATNAAGEATSTTDERGELGYIRFRSDIAVDIAGSIGGIPNDNSVTTVAIADGAVTAPKLAANAVTTNHVADGAITQAKLDPSIVVGGGGVSGSAAIAENVNALPPANAANRGRMVNLTNGTAGGGDEVYFCKRLANGAYDWKQIG